MKKFLCLCSALSMCLTLCACSGKNVAGTDVRNDVRDALAAEFKNFVELIPSGDTNLDAYLEEVFWSNEIYSSDVLSDDVFSIEIIKAERTDDQNEIPVYFVDATVNIESRDLNKYQELSQELENDWGEELSENWEERMVLAVAMSFSDSLLDGILLDEQRVKIDFTGTKPGDSIRVAINKSEPISLYDAMVSVDSADYREDSDEIPGEVPASSEDSYGHDIFDALAIAEKTVEQKLKSPSTAKFCKTSEYEVVCHGDTWTVQGWVDAQNSFGAMLRNNFTVIFTFNSSDKYTVESCNIG